MSEPDSDKKKFNERWRAICSDGSGVDHVAVLIDEDSDLHQSVYGKDESWEEELWC